MLEVERQDGDGAGVYEVEVRRADGSQVEIHLDAQFEPVGSAPDDDGSKRTRARTTELTSIGPVAPGDAGVALARHSLRSGPPEGAS